MSNSRTKYLALNAIIAALYVALVFAFQPISFGVGPLSLRLADILLVLPWYNKKLSYGVVLGVLIGNLTSPLGVIDWVVGPATTGLAILISNQMKSRWLVPFIQAVVTGLFISLELVWVYSVPFLVTFTSVALSTLVICIVGIVIFDAVKIEKLT